MPLGMVQRTLRSLNGSLYLNAIYLMANTAANQILGIVFWFFAARLYSTSDVGVAATIMTSLGFLAGLANLGLSTGLIRFLPEAKEKTKVMINSCVTISGLAGLILAASFLAGLDVWAQSLSRIRAEPIFLLSFILLGGILSIGFTADSVLVSHRRSHLVLWKQAFYGLRVPLVLIFAYFVGSFGVFGSWALASILATMAGLFLFIPRVVANYRPAISVEKSVVKKLIRFSLANHVAGIISAIPAGLTPLLISNILTTENAAYFYLAFTLSGVLTAVPGAMATSLFAEGSQPSSNFVRDTRKALKFSALLLSLGIAVFWFFGGFLLGIFGRHYSDAGLDLLRLLAISSVFVAINLTYQTKAMVEKNMRVIIGLAILTSTLALGLSYALLLSYGILAVGIAQLISQGITSIVVIFLWRPRWIFSRFHKSSG